MTKYLTSHFLLISPSLRRPLIGASRVFACRLFRSRFALRRFPGNGSLRATAAAACRFKRGCEFGLSPACLSNTQHVARTGKDEKQRKNALHSYRTGLTSSRSCCRLPSLPQSHVVSQLACSPSVTLSSLKRGIVFIFNYRVIMLVKMSAV